MPLIRLARAAAAVALSSLAVAASGTSCGTATSLPPSLAAAGGSVERLAAGVEEYGTVAISSPLLTRAADEPTSNPFDFKLDAAGPDKYFTDAKTEFQGRAAESEAVVQSLAIGASVAADPVLGAAQAAAVADFARARQQEARRLRSMEQRQTFLADSAERVLQAERQAADLKFRAAKANADRERAAKVKQARDDTALDLPTREQRVAEANQAHAEAVAAAGLERANATSAAEQKYADAALPATQAGTLPQFPVPAARPQEADKDIVKQPDAARGLLPGDGKLQAPGALLAGRAAPVIANRSAIITAAGDTTTEGIFTVLGNPQLSAQFTGKEVVFGVSMVAVNPGWRTRKGYAADVSVTVQYSYAPARPQVVEAFVNDPTIDPGLRVALATQQRLTPPTDPAARGSAALAVGDEVPAAHALGNLGTFGVPTDLGITPLVAAVSPMTETQALDLQSSNRRQDEFALSLSFALRSAGLTAQAGAFEQFVRQRQQDAVTATPAVAVNAYSHSGGMYGFQVGPRLQAIERVRKGKLPGPAEVLDRQSFPVLILYGFDHNDLVRVKRETDGRLAVYEARMLLVTTPQWVPADPDAAGERLTELQRLEWSYALARDLGQLDAAMAARDADAALKRAGTLAKFRAEALGYKAFGSGVVVDLPLDVFKGIAGRKAGAPPGTGPTRSDGP